MTDDPDELYLAEVVPSSNPFQERPEQPSQYRPQYEGPPQHDIGQDAGIRMIMPVGRSGWAIASGYLALFAPVMCITAPFALITGILAVREIRRNPKLHGLGRAWFGIIVGSLGILGLIGGIVTIAIETTR